MLGMSGQGILCPTDSQMTGQNELFPIDFQEKVIRHIKLLFDSAEVPVVQD